MLDTDNSYGQDANERIPPLLAQESRGHPGSLDIRRRIEHQRELKRLRELIDDPDFDELN